MEEKEMKEIEIVDEDKINTVTGGRNFGHGDWKVEQEKYLAIGYMWRDFPRLETPKYPCPKCGSWNVGNYDPGDLYLMRVYCKDCGFYGCRDGTDDDKWGNEIEYRLYRDGLIKYR